MTEVQHITLAASSGIAEVDNFGTFSQGDGGGIVGAIFRNCCLMRSRSRPSVLK